MDFHQSQRALDLMRCERHEQRRSPRIQFPVRAKVVFPILGTEPQTALLRDINRLGAFFYCKEGPKIGDELKMDFDGISNGEPMQVCCEGVVVRIENSIPGAAAGVAVEFTKYEALKARPSNEPVEHVSYVGWSIQMIEEMFARRPELESYAWRIQGAA